MNPVKSSLRYPQIALVLTAAVLAWGVQALINMPRREDPKITIRIGLVAAFYPGATAEQVENQVTRKIEERLFRFEEVRKAKTWSISRPGVAVVHVELEDNVRQPSVFWSRLRHNMIELKLRELPEGVRGPVVDDSFGDTVAVLVALHGGQYGYRELKEYAQRLEDGFRTLRAVAKIQRIGEVGEEIRITSSMERVSQYALSPLRVIQALRGRNVVQYAGAVDTAAGEVPLRPSGLFQTEDEIRRVMIDVSPSGQPVYVGDVARVERREREPEQICRYNGARAVLVSVEMLEGNNIVRFGEALRAKLEETRRTLPPDLKIDLIADQPAVVERRIAHFIREFGIAIGSVILVTMLLLPFRVALIASLAIPVTVAATFAMLEAFRIELHQVSISALIVVLGMVVDDAIVIADNYVELLDRGVERNEAAWRCATELTVPVLTATATIIAAFLPMLLISGSVGEFISALPVAVAVSLSCSFAVAMLLTPLLCLRFIRRGLHAPDLDSRKRTSLLDLMQSGYNRAIGWAMRHKAATVALGLGACAGGIALLALAPQRFFPTAERPQFVIDVWLPEGSRFERTDEVARRIEQVLAKEPLVASYSTFVGRSAPRFYYNVNPEFPAQNYAQFLVNTKSQEETPPLVFSLRRRLSAAAPEARVLVKELEQGTVMQAPVEVRIVGEDLSRLKAIGAQVEAILRRTPGAQYVWHNFREDSYDLNVEIDHETANRLGLNNESIALQLGGGFSGLPVTTFWEGDREVPVVLRLEEEYRRTFEDVGDSYVVSTLTGARVPLRSVARAAPEWRSSRIAHRNGVRTLTVHALQDEHTLASQVLARAMKEIESLPLPPGYRFEYGGERESQRETFGEMRVALLLSLVLIFLILLFQFRSPLQVLLIMMSIPFALPGAVLGLVLTGNPFSFTAFMGVISLSGIVVRNAIILVEYINERRRAGVDVEQAAREAGERRLRPIFLTTAAAAVGVTPMIASGSSLWSPLASVIAVGLLVSMFFTLVLVPVLYAAGARLRGGAGPAAAAALVALALAPASQAQEVRKLTLEEAQSMALGGNSWVKLARLKAKESERRAAGARSHYFPQISSESSVFYAGGLQSISLPRGALGVFPQLGPLPASDLTVLQGRNDYVLAMQSFGQPLTQLIKIRAGARAASEDAAIAGSEARRVEDEIRLKVTEAFLGVLVSERRTRAAQLESEAAEEALREARDAVASGAALGVKALEAEARRLELDNAHLAARIAESDVRAELNDLLGLPQEARLELVPPGSPPAEPAPLDALLAGAAARNPEVGAARHTVEKARQGLKAARAEHIPDLTFFTQHIYQNGVPFLPRNNATVGARLTVNLFDGGRRAAAASERQAQLEQAEENLRRLKNRLALEIGKIHRKAERLAGLRAVAEKALELRLEARRIVADQVEAGLATAAALKRAEAAAAQAEAQRFEAEAALRIALAELARAAGAR